MSGLSETERVGFKKILGLMTIPDLLSLSDTVTNKMIVVENTREAVETILSFTKNAEELLRRKKVQRELIFRYLAKEGVVMPPNSEKHQLVRRTLELWSSAKVVVDKRHQGAEDRQRQPRETPSNSTDMKTGVGFDPLVLGQQFCQWFFQLMNSQNPSLGQQPQDWGPQHFWPDVKLRLLSRTGIEQMEEFLGAELVSLRLLALSRDERLLFSPNPEPCGLKALASPHGLVLVAVAGTIHRDEVCLGIFEQIFGLIRSPLDNNSWKIKSVNLKIKGQEALGGTKVTAPALSYNSSELQLLCS
uniref:Chromosome 3 open reading frame 38 n=1 Tax=Acanthochromis polyacanthus TaxID=80966 RepID=A0A3Q1G671_9TELE